MDYYEYTNARAAVYQLAHNAGAPSQAKLLDVLRTAEQECTKNGTSHKDTIRIMLYHVFEGLMYGNWPRLLVNTSHNNIMPTKYQHSTRVHCSSCQWSGYRKNMPESREHKYGLCPKCNHPVERRMTHEERRNMRALEEMKKLDETIRITQR